MNLLSTFVSKPKAFTEEECKTLVNLGKKFEYGTIGNKEVDYTIRKSEVDWVRFDNVPKLIRDKFDFLLIDMNLRNYNFEIYGTDPEYQLTKYSEGFYYHRHKDTGMPLKNPGANRKFTVVIQLSKPEDYEGGELKFEEVAAPKEQGSMVIFPAFEYHEVTPVTKGERLSLVAFVNGPNFR
jgi:PKHD-type hydroxylase